MPNVGDSFPVGSTCQETGQYKHSACTNTIVINKGEKIPPCSVSTCPQKGADWILNKKLT